MRLQHSRSATLGTDQAKGAGSGSATAVISGVLHVNISATGTGANTDETDLMSYSLPANTLSANGKGVRITCSGTTAANGNNKTMILYFGSATLSTTALALNNGHWKFSVDVFRVSSGNQYMSAHVTHGVSDGSAQTVRGRHRFPTETDTGAITIKVTGTNGTGTANDIVARLLVVEALN